MSNAPSPLSTPPPSEGKILVPVGPRELLLGVTFLLGGGLAGLTGNTFTDPKLPPDVKESVDAARSAAADVSKSLSEIKTTLKVMEVEGARDRRDAGDLKSRMEKAETAIQELQRRPTR